MRKALILSAILFFCCWSVSAEQRIYWSSRNPTIRSVFSIKLNGTDLRTVIDLKTSVLGLINRVPGDIVIDDAAGRLYISDTANADIISTNLDGGDVQFVIHTGDNVDYFDIDSTAPTHTLYWTSNTGYVAKYPIGAPSFTQSLPTAFHGTAVSPIAGFVYMGRDNEIRYYNLNNFAGGVFSLTSTPSPVYAMRYMHAANQLTWYNDAAFKLMARRNSDPAPDRTLLQFQNNNAPPTAMAYIRNENFIFWTSGFNNAIYFQSMSNPTVPDPPQLFFNSPDPKGLAISCGAFAPDPDADGTPSCDESCPNDPAKIQPGDCGCGVADTDTDGDTIADCNDGCPADHTKIAPGQCGCGVPNTDSDGDGTADCVDGCITDPAKAAPGQCGCNVQEVVSDDDGDGVVFCKDACPGDSLKSHPGTCGCGVVDTPGCVPVPTPTPLPTDVPTLVPTSTPTPDSSGDIRILSPGLKLLDPPTVIVKGNVIKITFEKFTATTLTKGGIDKKSAALLEAKKPKITSKYTVTIANKTAKTKEVRSLSTKKNELTVKNLKPGNYSVNYRVDILKDGKSAGKTSVSPSAAFTIY